MATRNLIIVGAGFSANAGLPLTTGFTRELLNVGRSAASESSQILVEFIRRFVNDAFNSGQDIDPSKWPDLEDIFTSVDLAANTGHHLGPNYSAAKLRAVRRALIVRTIRMLNSRYSRSVAKPPATWAPLEDLLTRVDLGRTAFLSMNWDNVIERGISRNQGVNRFDYGCDARAVTFGENGLVSRGLVKSNSRATVLKPHGSINWLYCDACRQLYYVPGQRVPTLAYQLISDSDWELMGDHVGWEEPIRVHRPMNCLRCGAAALGTRFATFSYKKALEFPMHAATWQRAEQLLIRANTWIFVGYSMPAADYEFKYMLKRVQMSRKDPPSIVVVTGGDREAAQATGRTYERFFGSHPSGKRKFFFDGLDAAAFQELTRCGVFQ